MAALPGSRRGQGLHPAGAGVEILGDAFNRGAFPGGITALHDHHNPGAGLHHPPLHFHQFGLEPFQLGLIGFLRQFGGLFPFTFRHTFNLVFYLKFRHAVPHGLPRNERVNDFGGLHQVAGQFPAGALEMLRIHVGFGGVIVEALNEDEFSRVGG